MKTSQLTTILISAVLTAGAFSQENPTQTPGPSKGTVKTARHNAAAKTASNATPGLADFDDYVQRTIPIYPGDPALGPAGNIVSNLSDMTQYLLMYMNQGKHDGNQVISVGDIRQMISPQMVIHGADLDPELGYENYGMGLFVTTYRGHKFVNHGGNLDGFSLLISFLPDDNIGSVILLNMDGSSLREVLSQNINDRLLGLDQIDWSKRELDRYMKWDGSWLSQCTPTFLLGIVVEKSRLHSLAFLGNGMVQASDRIALIALVGAIADRKQTIHSWGFGSEKQFMAFPDVVLAEGGVASVMLYRYRSEGESCGYTWHASLRDAQGQAEYEYREALGPWLPIPPDVADAHQYAIAFARKSRET
jgi:Beta-lactamase